ncbi:nucleoside monophosphate kinase [Candidatus Woesearchaeota archaeon]|nr:nucleoside monophosphate kinase [Candidatus Woesearchaeota archaeon]
MIITISGTPGAGKSTAAKILAKRLGYSHYSTGDFMRTMAQERGISLQQMGTLAEQDTRIDQELDERQKQLGKNEDNFVIDGRISFYFIPHSLKVFLDADIKERAKRILKDQRASESHQSLNEAMANIKGREASEKKRYQKYYCLDYTNKKNFNLVLDTTNLTIQQTIDKLHTWITSNTHER